MKLHLVIGCLLFLFTMLASCSSDRGIYRQVSDIDGQKLGVLHETPAQNRLDSLFTSSTIKVYDKVINLFLDIEAGKCEAALLDEKTAVRVISRNMDYGCLDVLEVGDESKVYVIVPKQTPTAMMIRQIPKTGYSLPMTLSTDRKVAMKK